MKTKYLLFLVTLLAISGSLRAQQTSPPALPSNLYTTPGGIPSSGSGGGITSVAACTNNPSCISVTDTTKAGCFATVASGNDWSTCFASVTAAVVAAAKVSTGTPTIRSTVFTPMPTSATTSLTVTVNIPAGDTIIVGIVGSGPGSTPFTYTISDPGGNIYSAANLDTLGPANAATEQAAIYSSPVGNAKAASGTLTVTCVNGSEFFGFFVMDVFNVGSIGQRNIDTSGTSTTPNNAVTSATKTQDNNNLVVSVLEYCGGGATTLTANSGTLQASWNGTAIICGAGLVTNTSASPASLTNSATISASEPWAMSTMELRSVQITRPTIYFPTGTYNYASGLNPTLPVILKGERGGSILCYQGTAHEMDLGPSGLTSSTFQSDYYTVDSLKHDCGGSESEGIFINNWILRVEIVGNEWGSTGNQSAAFVWANGNQNDLFMHDNRYWINDGATQTVFPGTQGIPREWVDMTTNSNGASTLRFEHNSAACISGVVGVVGCNETFGTSPPLIKALGITHIILGNNFMGGGCPVIELLNGDSGTKVENNHFEADTAGCFPIALQTNVLGMRVLNNTYYDSSPSNVTPLVGPTDGAQVLTNMLVADNYLFNFTATTPVVKLNNLVGQTGNIARNNTCSTTAVVASSPCSLTHTLGGNIVQWNADYAPKLTFAAGTTATYTFGTTTYGATPVCTIPPNIPGTATTLTITTLNATTLTITASAVNSATVFAICNPEAQ